MNSSTITEALDALLVQAWRVMALFLSAVLLGSAAVTTGVLGMRLFNSSNLIFELTGMAILLFCLVCFWLLLRFHSSVRVAVGMIAIVALIRLALIAMATPYPQLADRGIFQWFTERLADSRYSSEMLRQMSGTYDYYTWVGRSFPFHGIFRIVFGAWHILAAQVLNVVVQALTALMLWSWLRSVAGTRVAGIALVALLLLPVNTWMVLDFTHQFLAASLLFAAVVALVLLLDPTKRFSHRKSLVFGLGLGLLLFLQALQKSIDLLTLATLALATPPLLYTSTQRRIIATNLGVVLVIALTISVPLKSGFNRWLASHDEKQLSSGVVGFMARGWSFERLGEYNGRYEQMDRITAPSQKRDEMLSIVVSRLADEPASVFSILLPVKFVKFFLVGYASGVEEGLRAGGSDRIAAIATGMRLIFAPVFLFLVALSAWRAARHRPPRWLAVLAVAIMLTTVVFVFFGETSPRYSIYVQAMLCALLGWGLCQPRQSEERLPVRKLALTVSLLFCGYLIFAALLHMLASHAPTRLRYANWPSVPLTISSLRDESYTRTWIVSHDHTTASVEISLDGNPAAQIVSFYLWPHLTRPGDEVRIMMAGKQCSQMDANEIHPVRRVELFVPPGTRNLQLEYSRTSEGPARELEYGFIRSRPASTATKTARANH